MIHDSTLTLINMRLAQAKKKHPVFAESPYHAVSLIGEEFGEMAQAINDGNEIKAIDEALDNIITLVRLIEEVYAHGSNRN